MQDARQAEQALRQAQQVRDVRQNELHALALDRTAAETSLAGMDGRRDTIATDIASASQRLAQEKQAQDELKRA